MIETLSYCQHRSGAVVCEPSAVYDAGSAIIWLHSVACTALVTLVHKAKRWQSQLYTFQAAYMAVDQLTSE